jgi:putative ABC transport system permease protein
MSDLATTSLRTRAGAQLRSLALRIAVSLRPTLTRIVRALGPAAARLEPHWQHAAAKLGPLVAPLLERLPTRLLSEAARNLASAKQRTLLALIGILIGTGSVIAMINIGAIVKAEALRDFLAMGTDIFSVSASGTKSKLTGGDVEELQEQGGPVRLIVPVMQASSQLSYAGKPASSGILVATTPGFFNVAKLRPSEGRFLSEYDRLEPFLVMGEAVRAELARNGQRPAIGDQVRLDRYVFQIVGFVDSPGFNPLIPIDANGSIFVSIPNLRRLSPTTELQMLVGRSTPAATPELVERHVSAFLQQRHSGMIIRVNTAQQLIRSMEKQMQLYTLLLGAVGSIALIVGGVGVMNVMLVSVTERRREIGIRMAIGARRQRIRSMFLTEAVLLSLIGGAIGTAVGVGASAIMASMSGWEFHLAVAAIPLGAGISAAVGIFFGFYPAVQASKLDPIQALRSE